MRNFTRVKSPAPLRPILCPPRAPTGARKLARHRRSLTGLKQQASRPLTYMAICLLFLFYFHYAFFILALRPLTYMAYSQKQRPRVHFARKSPYTDFREFCPGKPATHAGGGGGKEGGLLAIDASVMNLSHAAVRQLSCPPEEAQASPRPTGTGPGATGANEAQDSSVIGMSRSAMREVSVRGEERASNKFSKSSIA